MRPTTVLAAFTAACLAFSPLAALAQSQQLAKGEVPEAAAWPPVGALARIDDSDLNDEETLEDLQDEEFDQEAWSTGEAVGLSLLPGGGFGLVYAENKPAAVIPMALSAIGYGLGLAYLLGVFNESSTEVCQHETAGVVPVERCSFGTDPDMNKQVDDLAEGGKRFYQTQQDYTRGTAGEDFDGAKYGIGIIAGTYLFTTAIGAIWSASNVSTHNEEIRKSIESTAQGPQPIVRYDGDQGFLGFAIEF